MGKQETPAGSRKLLCQGEGRRFCSAFRGGSSDEHMGIPGSSAGQEGTRGKTRGRVPSCRKMLRLSINAGTWQTQLSTNLWQSSNLFDSHCHLHSIGVLLLSESQGPTFCHPRDVIHCTENRNEFWNRRWAKNGMGGDIMDFRWIQVRSLVSTLPQLSMWSWKKITRSCWCQILHLWSKCVW